MEKNPTTMAQNSASLGSQIAGAPTPDHDLTVLGLGNVNRYFDLLDPSNGPSLITRTVTPYASFTKGYSAAGSRSDQDDGSATNTALVATDVLTPITPMTLYIEEDVWPILTNLFSSGTGQRYDVSIHEFVRYFAMLTSAYSWMLDIVRINNLAYHFDWTSVFPFSETVPLSVYAAATKLEADDVGIASRWLPLMKRFDDKVMFPRMIQEIKRLVQPMQSVDFNGRLCQTFEYNLFAGTIDVDTYYDQITEWLDYIDVNLARAGSVFTSFLPFPMRASNPWALTSEPIVDLDKDTGWFNSGVTNTNVFGDTGDPDNSNSLTFDPSLSDVVYWWSRHTQPVWAGVKWASLWQLIPGVDDEFQLITPHLWKAIILPDDTNSYFVYDGSDIGTASAGFIYTEFANSRFAERSDVLWGTQKPGMLGAEIYINPVIRLLRLEVQYLFNLEVLKLIIAQMSGASIREIRFTIQQQVAAGVQSPL
jgi:hypothetical protein